MDGFQVLPMARAAPLGDLFVTATGVAGVIRAEHFLAMRDGAMLANSGHFDVEVDVAALRRLAVAEERVRDHLVGYRLPNGRTLFLLAEGRLVGQAAAEASPATVMDLSFAGQALSTRFLVETAAQLSPEVHPVPAGIDQRVARLKLQALGLEIDQLAPDQLAYQRTWDVGTAERVTVGAP